MLKSSNYAIVVGAGTSRVVVGSTDLSRHQSWGHALCYCERHCYRLESRRRQPNFSYCGESSVPELNGIKSVWFQCGISTRSARASIVRRNKRGLHGRSSSSLSSHTSSLFPVKKGVSA